MPATEDCLVVIIWGRSRDQKIKVKAWETEIYRFRLLMQDNSMCPIWGGGCIL